MSSPFYERSSVEASLSDQLARIRTLEALVSSGGDPTVCPDCVLDPYTVNPGDIVVPPAYYDCVDVSGWAYEEITPQCGTNGPNFIIGAMPIGFCSSFDLSKPLGLQVAANVDAPSGNLANVCIWLGTNGVLGSQILCRTFDVGYNGTVTIPWTLVDHSGICAVESCDVLDIGLSFYTYSSFTPRCATGTVAARIVELDEDGEYRGALDDLPPGEAYGDVLYFDASSGDIWKPGARSIPSRAISTFMG